MVTNSSIDEDEESLITQFETTLNIRPTTDEDISIDHTTFIHGANLELRSDDKLNIGRLNVVGSSKNHQILHDQSHNPLNGEFTPDDTSRFSLSKANLSDDIDLDMSQFKRRFNEFLTANPQIYELSYKFESKSDETLILLSPYSPEHAFGRKWVSKSYLSTIFERPQRLLATSIGIAAAKTMFPFFYDVRCCTKRASIFSSYVQKVHGSKWPQTLQELCLQSDSKLERDELEVPKEWNSGDIYIIPRTLTALEGVLGTIEMAIDSLYTDERLPEFHKLVFAVIRPPGHHSHASLPSGFCMLNNAQIAVEYANETYNVSHCAILDIDLHHGDGSQDICWERAGFLGDYGKESPDGDTDSRDEFGKSKPRAPVVGYFSLHDIKSYPTELGYATKENIKNASLCVMDHDLVLWNVHLQEWQSEDEFYKLYKTKYVAILNRANQFLLQLKKNHEQLVTEYLADLAKYNKYRARPHTFKQPVKKPKPVPVFKPLIIISAGFDASEYEDAQMQRHGVNVPTSFYSTFSKDVVKLAQIHTEGRVLSVLEGGYSDAALISGLFSHLIGFTNNPDKSSENDENLWDHAWGSSLVMRELSKGCRSLWLPYKNPKTELTVWANEVIKLGRAMLPNSILPTDYIYGKPKRQVDPETLRESSTSPQAPRMLRDILSDEASNLISESPKRDPDDKRRLLRFTRSQQRKNN